VCVIGCCCLAFVFPHPYATATLPVQQAGVCCCIVPKTNIQTVADHLLSSVTRKKQPGFRETQQYSAGNIMKNDKKTSKAGNPARLPLSKPGVFALIANIARATLSGGMLWFVFFGAVVVAFLHFNQVPAEHLLALLIAAIVVIAFVRGIREWQNELDEYQRELTEYRMNMADVRNKQQVKKDIVWDRH
jgi:hypothetical protein